MGGTGPISGFRFPGGRLGGGGLGIGGVVVVLIIGWIAGINPLDLLNGTGGGTSTVGGQSSSPITGKMGTPTDQGGQFVATVLADTEDAWTEIFSASGKQYEVPTLVLFNGQTESACGFASAASGPFYCSNDRKVYIDLAFYDELRTRFNAPGEFAEAYVIAHEVGHHVQNLLGILPQVDQQRSQASEAEANQLSVRLELQADCFAGIWAHVAEKKKIVEVGDIDAALNAAAQIGDDTLQKRSQGYVVPETFTHGSAAQRSSWFKRGYTQGVLGACDTFASSAI